MEVLLTSRLKCPSRCLSVILVVPALSWQLSASHSAIYLTHSPKKNSVFSFRTRISLSCKLFTSSIISETALCFLSAFFASVQSLDRPLKPDDNIHILSLLTSVSVFELLLLCAACFSCERDSFLRAPQEKQPSGKLFCLSIC